MISFHEERPERGMVGVSVGECRIREAVSHTLKYHADYFRQQVFLHKNESKIFTDLPKHVRLKRN